MRLIVTRSICTAVLLVATTAGALADENYRDVFYLTFRTRDFRKPDRARRQAQNRDMIAKIEDMKRRLGLDKRKMKYFRVGFQLPPHFAQAVMATGTASNRNTSSYHRQVYTPSFKLKAVVDREPRYAMWYKDNKSVGQKRPGPHGLIYATTSMNAQLLWQMWGRRLIKSSPNVARDSRASSPFICMSGPGEGGLNHQTPRRKGKEVANWTDYSPFAISEFRDWLTHRGLYSRRGLFRGQGRAGGELFADDPSPGKAGGDNKTFNETYGTDFTTWKLRYWDLERFPTMAPKATRMPADDEDGAIAGGFDAPRKRDDKNLFWRAWDNTDRKDPGFRQVMIHHYVTETHRILAKTGMPRDRIFSHQCFFPESQAEPFVDWWMGGRLFLSGAPLWTAVTPHGRPGFTMYNNSTRDENTFRLIWDLLDADERKYHKFALTEYHPYSTDRVSKGKTKEDYAKALALIAKWRPHVLVVCCWEGNTYGRNTGYKVKDTPFEAALKDMIADWQDKPFWQVPDPTTLPSLRPSGADKR